MTLSISKEERNGEYKVYLKEETTSCLLDNQFAGGFSVFSKKR